MTEELVMPSCGCVFCDIGVPVEGQIEGSPCHTIEPDNGKGVMLIECTREKLNAPRLRNQHVHA